VSRRDASTATALGAGLLFLLLGGALLLQELAGPPVRWSVVLPVVLIAVGAATASAGLAGAARSRDRA
jgi:hypothetical protein